MPPVQKLVGPLAVIDGVKPLVEMLLFPVLLQLFAVTVTPRFTEPVEPAVNVIASVP